MCPKEKVVQHSKTTKLKRKDNKAITKYARYQGTDEADSESLQT